MSDFWDDGWEVEKCPGCGSYNLVTANGPDDSPILIIGEFPGKEEIGQLQPMVGPMGQVLSKELSFLGIPINSVQRTNVWLHEPNGNEECLQHGIEEAIKISTGKQAVLLLGSDCAKIFLDQGVMDVAGINCKSDLLSAPIIIPCPNPAIVYHGGIGEVRLSLQKFANLCREKGVI